MLRDSATVIEPQLPLQTLMFELWHFADACNRIEIFALYVRTQKAASVSIGSAVMFTRLMCNLGSEFSDIASHLYISSRE
jgi:hypothetical protein